MLDRQKRLNEVYEHLHNYFNIHTKGDFADSIKYARAYISSALNGNKKYLTDKLFSNICEAYPGVFDLNYLLTGDGSLLTIEEEVHNEEFEKLYNPQPIDQSSLVNALLASKDETIDSLKSRIADLQRTIADKEEIIKSREARIAELERQLGAASTSDLSHYPFAIGAAEQSQSITKKESR
jgi:hypothetical protein